MYTSWEWVTRTGNESCQLFNCFSFIYLFDFSSFSGTNLHQINSTFKVQKINTRFDIVFAGFKLIAYFSAGSISTLQPYKNCKE